MDRTASTLLIIGLVGALFVTWLMWPSGNVLDLNKTPQLDVATQEERVLDSEPREGVGYQNIRASDIAVDLPFPYATVGTEFSVRGIVSETWLGGKSMTVFVYAASGEEIGIASVEASGTGVLAFRSDVVVRGYVGEATVILVRNDSDATPDSASLISFPVVVKP